MEAGSHTPLLAAKPEVLYPFDESQLETLRQTPRLAIGETAGRDSVAAMLAAMASDDIDVIQPIAVYTATEYGDWLAFERNAEFLRRKARELYGKEVRDLVWMGSPKLWEALNGRFITEIVRRYGNYSPCLACHFYLHAIRVPLAVRLGCRVVIGGDRERHGPRLKINQIPAAMDAYDRFFRRFGLELWQPLRRVIDPAGVEEMLGPDWPGGNAQPQCVLSGNYYTADGRDAWTEAGVLAFVEGFAYPALERIVSGLVEGRAVDYVAVVQEILMGGHQT